MGVEDLKRALQESGRMESWRNKIVKEVPLVDLPEEHRKSLVSRCANFEQLTKRSSCNETENKPPKIFRRPFSGILAEKRQQFEAKIPAFLTRRSDRVEKQPKAPKQKDERLDVKDENSTRMEAGEENFDGNQANYDGDRFVFLTKNDTNNAKIAEKMGKIDERKELFFNGQPPAIESDSKRDKIAPTKTTDIGDESDQSTPSTSLPIKKKNLTRPLKNRRPPTHLRKKLLDANLDGTKFETTISPCVEFDTLKNNSNIKLGEELSLCRGAPAQQQQQPRPDNGTRTTTTMGENRRTQLAFRLSVDAFQTPIIGREHCGVNLRRVDTNSPFPDVIRPLRVRLVCPMYFAGQQFARPFGSYLLITREQLIVWNSPNATVFSKSKASQMAYEILAGKELRCAASHVAIADEDRATMAAFRRLTAAGQTANESPNEESIFTTAITTTNDVESGESVENPFKFDRVFCVQSADQIKLVREGSPPDVKLFDSTKVLIFDFVTEIHVWIGQNCDRSLVGHAQKNAELLRNTPLSAEQQAIFGAISGEERSARRRPDWTIVRKQTQGIADCLFRFKFDGWTERMAEIAGPRQSFITPGPPPTASKGGAQPTLKRPWSVPAAAMGGAILSNRISALCSDNAYFGILKDENKLINELADELGRRPIVARQPLQLDGVELRVSDANVFTERLIFHRLAHEENLQLLEDRLAEFDNASCYVIEWHYRIEREGIRKLNGDRVAVHETGRQRVAHFYWLGRHSTNKDRSRCALALIKYDKDRQEHIRIEAGNEPPIFLNILDGEMIISGTNSNCFLVVGSDDRLFNAEELPSRLDFRAQGAYLRVIPPSCDNNAGGGRVECWHGELCSPPTIRAAERLAHRLASVRGLRFDPNRRLLLSANSLNEFVGVNADETSTPRLLYPSKWTGTAPRMYRIFGMEGEELGCERYDIGLNFTFSQTDLRDCIFVDQGTLLWIWSEGIVRTFELKLADKIWHEINGKSRASKEDVLIIKKGHEPDEFKALYPTWKDAEKSPDNNTDDDDVNIECGVQYLADVLHERTRHRTLDELRNRQLPKGSDTKHLERYLSDADFLATFKCTRKEYEGLPRWRQITLKKAADLF